MPRIKLRHIPPNVATSASLMVALCSVMMAIDGDFELAAWMILWSVFLDKLDGSLARLLKAGTEFGVEFDSIADFCAFGVAPGFFAHEMLRHHEATAAIFATGTNLWLMRLVVGIYVVAVGARLARFNVDTPVLGDKYFMGIPTTMCGGILATLYLTCDKYAFTTGLQWFPAYLLIAAFLMVSTVRLPKLTSRKNKLLNAFQVVAALFSLVLSIGRWLPDVLFGMAMTYFVVGLLHTRIVGVGRKAARPNLL